MHDVRLVLLRGRTFGPSTKNQMKRETYRTLRQLAYYSSIGLSMALAIFIGLAVGVYLDRKWGSSPWMTLIFLVLGIAAGYKNLGLAIRKSRKL